MSALSPLPKIIGLFSAYSEVISAISWLISKSEGTSLLISITVTFKILGFALACSTVDLALVEYLRLLYDLVKLFS